MTRFRMVLPVALFTCLLPSSVAQFPGPQQSRPRRASDQELKMEREQAKKLNQQRHANLKKDTDRLLELATQLKQQVDKSNENTLSLDVIKKCEEIEKLAHSVKQKMKGD